MAVVVGVLGMKAGTMPRNREDLSGKDKMSKDSNYDDDRGSGGGARDKRGTMPSNGEDWSGHNKMCEDSNNDDDGGSGGIVSTKGGIMPCS
jgi:hypothetical protein